MAFVGRLISHYSSLSPVKYSFVTAIFTVSLQIFFVFVLFGVLSLFTSPSVVHDDISSAEDVHAEFDPIKVLLMSVLLAPIIETLVFQYGLIVLLQRVVGKRGWLWFLSTLAFSALHLRRSELSAIQAFISGGFFANAFLHWYGKTEQPWLAARVTCLSHMFHNFAYLIMNYIPAYVLFGIF